ncbi:MAG: serine hydrolase [Bacteroidota bacterium]
MRLALLALALVASSCSSAQPTPAASSTDLPDGLEALIDQIAQEELEASHQPGIAIVLVKDGQTLLKKGYGLANVETGTPVDPDRTLFRIGSVSKALTGLALTALVDQGRVSYEDDVAQYVDGIRNVGGFEEPVTVWNLLTHTGGFDQIGGSDRQIRQLDLGLDARLALRPSLGEYLADGKLRRVNAPGERFRYDTFGITLAGHIVGEATGQSYAEAMREVLFEPIGMTRSFVEAPAAARGDLALGYGWVEGEYVPQPYEVYVTTPAASIDATPADMGRLLEVLTGGGANAHGRLFSPERAEAVLASQFQPHPRFTGATHGFWEMSEMDLPGPPPGPQVRTVGHGGSMLGYATSFNVFTEANVGLLVVTNRNFEAGGGPDRVRGRVAEAVMNAYYPAIPARDLPEAVSVGERDLSAYAGYFVDGVHCRTCTEAEYQQGAWRPRSPRHVTVTDEGLQLEDARYLPTADPDVFVHAEGLHELLFGRAGDGRVDFLVFSYSPYTYDRVPDDQATDLEASEAAFQAVQSGLNEAAELADAGDTNAAVELATSSLRVGLDAGVLNEATINSIGYQFLGGDELALALAVFQFNVDAFPESWNAHDSLGEALAEAERTEEAIAAYERSLELNPESETGREALERLRDE